MNKSDKSSTSSEEVGERCCPCPCKVSSQSPININNLTVIRKNYPPIVASGYVAATSKMTLTNIGHTVEIRPCVDGPQAFINGGPLKKKYKFSQLHFHWGSTDVGSEHSIDGNFYLMEAHFVHYNCKYQDIEESSKKLDRLVVVAIFLESKSRNDDQEDYPAIATITHLPPCTRMMGTLEDVFPGTTAFITDFETNKNPYYTYKGSLTTAQFTENVIWLVYPMAVNISRSRINLFRKLRISAGCKIVSNCRKTQPLGERKIFLAADKSVPKNEVGNP